MGKQGPCYHCGVTSTPLWRNGPPEKPILCNACGSRWRTKGTLANYTPLHAREEPIDSVDFKVSKVKSIYIKTKDQKFRKPKQCNYNVRVEAKAPHCDQNFRKVLEEDTSNRSSSGSATSYSESCAQFGSIDASDLTGSEQSNVWDTFPPLRKKACIKRPKPSPVEKLTKDLCSILHEQQSSYLSRSSEEDLLFESETPMVPVEIGHGGVLIRYPNSASQEEESEASSLPINNKKHIVNGNYSGSAYLPIHLERKGISLPTVSIEKVKTLTTVGAQEYTKRDRFSHEKFHTLQNSNSPLIPIDLRDVANFEEFTRLLTCEEQQQLMKNLPSTDTTKLPDSLKSMFDSHQFVETLLSFQQLLREGIFDNSFLGANTEECRTLKRLVLANLTKSNWVEHYKLLKDVKHKQITRGKGVITGPSFHGPGNLASVKRFRNDQNPEANSTVKFPKRVHKSGSANLPSIRSPELNFSDVGYDNKDLMDSDGSCFSPRTLFAYPPDRISVTLDSLEFTDDISNQDLLIDVPSNASFPEAELLDSRLYKQRKALSNCSMLKSEVSDKEETLSNEHPSSSFSSQRSSTSRSLIYPLVLP